LLKVFDEIDRERQYVLLLVDSSSFDTFRATRQELERRKIGYVWEPVDKVDIILSFATHRRRSEGPRISSAHGRIRPPPIEREPD
jgi:hypothetical protein